MFPGRAAAMNSHSLLPLPSWEVPEVCTAPAAPAVLLLLLPPCVRGGMGVSEGSVSHTSESARNLCACRVSPRALAARGLSGCPAVPSCAPGSAQGGAAGTGNAALAKGRGIPSGHSRGSCRANTSHGSQGPSLLPAASQPPCSWRRAPAGPAPGAPHTSANVYMGPAALPPTSPSPQSCLTASPGPLCLSQLCLVLLQKPQRFALEYQK